MPRRSNPSVLRKLCPRDTNTSCFPAPFHPLLTTSPTQYTPRISETHIIIQVKFLLAHHRGAGLGFGEILEAAGALK